MTQTPLAANDSECIHCLEPFDNDVNRRSSDHPDYCRWESCEAAGEKAMTEDLAADLRWEDRMDAREDRIELERSREIVKGSDQAERGL